MRRTMLNCSRVSSCLLYLIFSKKLGFFGVCVCVGGRGGGVIYICWLPLSLALQWTWPLIARGLQWPPTLSSKTTCTRLMSIIICRSTYHEKFNPLCQCLHSWSSGKKPLSQRGFAMKDLEGPPLECRCGKSMPRQTWALTPLCLLWKFRI